MKKTFFILSVVLLLNFSLVFAHGEETFTEAENLIESKIPCDQLTEDQLEVIGDYYMEQMHPGEAHEAMDEMMGGEGSESLRQMHINMAMAFYCGEHDAMSSGMMDMMMGRGMGMMGYSGLQSRGGMMNMMSGYGMTGGTFGTNLFGFIYFTIGAFVFSVIFWLTYNWLVKEKKKR